MGRPPWTTPEQLEFLQGFVPRLDDEKDGNGLKPFYTSIAMEFVRRWPPAVYPSDLEESETPAAAKVVAFNRKERVS